MKVALVGIVIGIAVALTLLFATSGGKTEPANVETDRAAAAITVAKCDAGMSSFTAEIEKAVQQPTAALRQQVAQILAVHEEVCTKAATSVRTARAARPDAQLDAAIARIDSHVARLRAVSQAFATYEVALGSAMLAGAGSAADVAAAGAGSAELAALLAATRGAGRSTGAH